MEFAARLSMSKMARTPNATGVGQVLHKLRLLADNDWREVKATLEREGKTIDCKAGCNSCCHEPMPVSYLEILDIAVKLKESFSDEQRQELRDRAKAYRRNRADGQSFQPCPFLVGGLCSIYEFRPLVCRGRHSTDVKACEDRLKGGDVARPGSNGYLATCAAMMDGLSMGIPGKTSPDRYDLGIMAERIANGGDADAHILNAMAYQGAPALRAGEPTGLPEGMPPLTPPEIDEFYQLKDAGRLETAFGRLAGQSDAKRLLMSFWVPLAYETQDQLLDWRARAEKVLGELEVQPFDPAEAFNTLTFHSTCYFGYQGLPLKETFGRFGKVVHDKIIAPLFPDLVAPIEGKRKPGKIRIGYASPDLANKNGTRWALGWLESHGPEFETFAINIGALEDRLTERFICASDNYLNLPLPVPQAGRAIRDLDLDVLIYPEVGQNGRAVQFASMRLSRVQCTGWGYPATSGLPNVDHYISGDWMHLDNGSDEFTERLVRLPQTGQILEPPLLPQGSRDLPPLPPDYILMGQNLAKLEPAWDYLYAEICSRTGKPIVMVEQLQEGVNRVIKKRLAKNGVNVHWVPFMSYTQYRALQEGAALSLDTQIWSGGYTTFEALTLGLPVVSLPGESMRSRLSVAFLRQAGVEKLLATSPEEYIQLASDTPRVREIMTGLDAERIYGDCCGIGDSLNSFIRSSVTP